MAILLKKHNKLVGKWLFLLGTKENISLHEKLHGYNKLFLPIK